MDRKPAILLLVFGALCHLSGLACLFAAGANALASFQEARAAGADTAASNLWVLLMVAAMTLFAIGIVLLLLGFKRLWSGGSSGPVTDD